MLVADASNKAQYLTKECSPCHSFRIFISNELGLSQGSKEKRYCIYSVETSAGAYFSRSPRISVRLSFDSLFLSEQAIGELLEGTESAAVRQHDAGTKQLVFQGL